MKRLRAKSLEDYVVMRYSNKMVVVAVTRLLGTISSGVGGNGCHCLREKVNKVVWGDGCPQGQELIDGVILDGIFEEVETQRHVARPNLITAPAQLRVELFCSESENHLSSSAVYPNCEPPTPVNIAWSLCHGLDTYQIVDLGNMDPVGHGDSFLGPRRYDAPELYKLRTGKVREIPHPTEQWGLLLIQFFPRDVTSSTSGRFSSS